MNTPIRDLPPDAREQRIRDFHEVYYYSRLWEHTRWLGVPAWKCPLDLWIYQEILYETRPELIIETGTAYGGSALFLASICDMLGRGRVLTIDIAPRQRLPQHDRITYLTGSSLDDAVVASVREQASHADAVMLILDSLHRMDHVLAELRLYAPLVTPGCYAIVEDSNINGHPVHTSYEPDQGPGPYEAVRAYLNETDRFEIDFSRQKFLMTFNPGGYLRCVK